MGSHDQRSRLQRLQRNRRRPRPLRLDPRTQRRGRPARGGDRDPRHAGAARHCAAPPVWLDRPRGCSRPRGPYPRPGIGFFILLAVVASEATQAVGALLLLGLLAAPGGAARLLTDRPWLGLGLSAALALASMWIGLALSYQIATLPPSSAVIGVAAALYALAALIARLRTSRPGLLGTP